MFPIIRLHCTYSLVDGTWLNPPMANRLISTPSQLRWTSYNKMIATVTRKYKVLSTISWAICKCMESDQSSDLPSCIFMITLVLLNCGSYGWVFHQSILIWDLWNVDSAIWSVQLCWSSYFPSKNNDCHQLVDTWVRLLWQPWGKPAAKQIIVRVTVWWVLEKNISHPRTSCRLLYC